MDHIITLQQITEERLPKVMPLNYVFNERHDRSWRGWKAKLARWAFRLLCKHGFLTNAVGEEVSYKVARVDQRDILDTLYNTGMIAPYVLDRGLEKIYVGREEFEALIRHEGFAPYADPMAISTSPRFMGIQIVVLPWIKGVVPVPKGY